MKTIIIFTLVTLTQLAFSSSTYIELAEALVLISNSIGESGGEQKTIVCYKSLGEQGYLFEVVSNNSEMEGVSKTSYLAEIDRDSSVRSIVKILKTYKNEAIFSCEEGFSEVYRTHSY